MRERASISELLTPIEHARLLLALEMEPSLREVWERDRRQDWIFRYYATMQFSRPRTYGYIVNLSVA